MTPRPTTTSGRPSNRGFWIGFAIVLALLIVAPLMLPPFWSRFATEILIWGLFAMSEWTWTSRTLAPARRAIPSASGSACSPNGEPSSGTTRER
jgi:hypothetical protein